MSLTMDGGVARDPLPDVVKGLITHQRAHEYRSRPSLKIYGELSQERGTPTRDTVTGCEAGSSPHHNQRNPVTHPDIVCPKTGGPIRPAAFSCCQWNETTYFVWCPDCRVWHQVKRESNHV